MHRVTGAISNGEMYVHAVADNINSGFHDVGSGIQTGRGLMRGVASHQRDVVTDATNSLSNNVKKSIINCRKEAGRLAKAVEEFVDVEDIVKSIHKFVYPEKYQNRQSNIIHKPIDTNRFSPQGKQCLTPVQEYEDNDVSDQGSFMLIDGRGSQINQAERLATRLQNDQKHSHAHLSRKLRLRKTGNGSFSTTNSSQKKTQIIDNSA